MANEPKYVNRANLERLYDNIKQREVQTFDTVADMQACAWLKAGMTCHTNGFHTAGDGGAAYYTVGATGTANGMDVLACAGGLFATLMVVEIVTPEQLGAYGDGTHDDAAAIAKGLTYDAPLVFLDKTYGVGSPITVSKSLSVNDNAQLKAIAAIDAILNVQDSTGDALRITGGIYDCNSNANYGIKLTGSYGSYIDGVKVLNANTASVNYVDGCNHCWICNSKLFNPSTLATGILDVCRDLKVINCEIYYTNCAIDVQWTIATISNCHFWSGGAANQNEETIGIKATQSLQYELICNSVYIDSFKYGIKADSTTYKRINAIGCLFYWADTTTPKTVYGVYVDSGWQWLLNSDGSMFIAATGITMTQVSAGSYTLYGNRSLIDVSSLITPTANCTVNYKFAYVKDGVLYLSFIIVTAGQTIDSNNWYKILEFDQYCPVAVRERMVFTCYDDTVDEALNCRIQPVSGKTTLYLNKITATGHYVYGSIAIPLRG